MPNQEHFEILKQGVATVGWFPVFTLLLGYVIKSVSDWLQHRRTLERDRETREAARRDQLSERRTSFQRQTLLDLQEALMDLARTTGAMHHQDLMAYRNTGEWQKQLFQHDLDESSRLANRRTSMLAVRVRDASVRELVQTFKDHATTVVMGVTKDGSASAMASLMPVFEELNQRIGELLRQIDEEI